MSKQTNKQNCWELAETSRNDKKPLFKAQFLLLFIMDLGRKDALWHVRDRIFCALWHFFISLHLSLHCWSGGSQKKLITFSRESSTSGYPALHKSLSRREPKTQHWKLFPPGLDFPTCRRSVPADRGAIGRHTSFPTFHSRCLGHRFSDSTLQVCLLRLLFSLKY